VRPFFKEWEHREKFVAEASSLGALNPLSRKGRAHDEEGFLTALRSVRNDGCDRRTRRSCFTRAGARPSGQSGSLSVPEPSRPASRHSTELPAHQ
jgi:hypothetical protein